MSHPGHRASHPAHAILDAIERFATGRPAPDEVAGLIAMGQPAITAAALQYIAARLDEGEPSATWAPLIPPGVEGQPPEIARAIADLHARGLPEAPGLDPAAEPPRSAAVAWARARLVVGWGSGRTAAGGDPGAIEPTLPYAAIASLDWDPVPDLMGVLDAIRCHPGRPPIMARPVARALASMGLTGRLPATVLVRPLAELIPTAAADIALEALVAPWALGVPLPASCFTGALDTLAAPAAARALAIRGHWDALAAALADDTLRPMAHRAVIEAVEPHPQGPSVAAVLDRALGDPLYFGPAAFEALQRLRPHAPLTPAQVGAAFALYLDGPPVDAARVAQVIGHPADVMHAIDVRLAEAPRCVRSVALLAALPARRATPRLIALLDAPAHRHLATPILRALAEPPHQAQAGVVDAIARCLDRRPVEGARALARVIGPETLAAADRLPPRARAQLIARHAPDGLDWPGWVAAGAVDGAVIGALTAARFEGARVDLEGWAAAPGHPLQRAAIDALGRLGDDRSIPALAAGLLAPSAPEAPEDTHPAEAAREALRGLGAGVGGGTNPLARALAHLIPSSAEGPALAQLLAELAESGAHGVGLAVRPALRHRDPEVRKHAVRALAHAEHPGATAWIASLAGDDDPRVLRAVYEALGARGERWTASVVAAGLEHPLMNLKKSAARALATAGDVGALPRVLSWLGRHDNPGLRAALIDAARAIAGDGRVGAVRAAIDGAWAADDPERVRRLLPTLDRAVPRARITRWLATLPWAGALRAALDDGTLRPRDGAAPDDPPDPGDQAGRRARAALLAWPMRGAAALETHLRRLPPDAAIDAPLFDRLWAAYALPGAPRGLIRAHLTRGRGIPATHRFAAVCAVRRHTPADEREHAAVALAALGALPDDDERLRWQAHPDPSVRRVARRAHPASVILDPGSAGAWADALPDAIAGVIRGDDAIPLDEIIAQPGGWLIDGLGRVAGSAALLEILAGVVARGRSARGERACIEWCLADDTRWPVLDGLTHLPLAPENRLWVYRAVPSIERAAALRAMIPGPCADEARGVLADWGRLGLDEHLAALRAGRPSPGGEGAEIALRMAAQGPPAPVERGWLWSDALEASVESRAAALAWTAHRAGPDAGPPPPMYALDVLPHIIDDLRAGRFERIPLLQPTRLPAPALIELYRDADPTGRFAARLRRYFAGGARLGRVHAPGLLDALLSHPRSLDDAGWTTLLGLTDAWLPAGRDRIIDALGSHLDPIAAGQRLVDALEGHPAAAQIPLLMPWRAAPAVEARLAALLVEQDPTARRLIPAALHPTLLARAVAALGERVADGPKRTLSTLVALDHPDTQGHLIAALDHRSPAVRAHAHRLLRRHAPRAVYLDATRRHLLAGRHPEVMRRAVRVLCYGGDRAAVPGVVAHLDAAHRGLREAAHAGLVYLGDAALGPLHRALGHARPDRRAAISAVITDIAAGADGLDEDETDDHRSPARRW